MPIVVRHPAPGRVREIVAAFDAAAAEFGGIELAEGVLSVTDPEILSDEWLRRQQWNMSRWSDPAVRAAERAKGDRRHALLRGLHGALRAVR